MSLSEGAALCEPQVPSAHATPAEGLQVLGLIIAAVRQRNLVDNLQDEDSFTHDGVAASGVLAGVVIAFFDALAQLGGHEGAFAAFGPCPADFAFEGFGERVEGWGVEGDGDGAVFFAAG